MNSVVLNYVLPLGLMAVFAYMTFFKPQKDKTEKNQFGEITYSFLAPKSAQAKLDDENVLIVDVRKEDYYKKSHLKNSVNLPFSEINKNCRKLIPNKKLEILVYDNDGGRLSKNMVQEFYNLGYKNVHDIGAMNSYRTYIVTEEN